MPDAEGIVQIMSMDGRRHTGDRSPGTRPERLNPRRHWLAVLASSVVCALSLLVGAPSVALAVSLRDGDIFVPEAGSGTLTRFDSAGASSDLLASGLSVPIGVTLGPDGNLYVAGQVADAVYQINPVTGATTTLTSGGSIVNPQAIVAAPNGNLYITSRDNKAIVQVTPGGTQSVLTSGGLLNNPTGITIDAGGDLIVVDTGSPKRAIRVTTGGTQSVIAAVTSPSVLSGIAVGRGSNLGDFFIADGSGVVIRVTPGGASSTFGSAPGSLVGIAAAANGGFYVSDINMNRLLNLNADGTTGSLVAPTGATPWMLSVYANQQPTLSFSGGSGSYTEGAGATVIDAGAVVTDPYSADFDTGTLTVDYTAGGSANDRLEIQNQGNGPGQIGVSGSTVSFGGTAIGTFSGGTGTTPLVVTFGPNATIAATQALVRAVTFRNVGDILPPPSRTVRFVLTDGDGATTGAQTHQIVISATNTAPVNSVPGAQTTPANTALTFSTANGNAISASDPDGGSADEQMTLGVSSGTLTVGAAGTAPPLTSLSGNGTATVTLNGSLANINAALQGLTFTPTTNVTGPVTLTVTTNDLGNTGSPGPLTDTDIVTITVGALPTLSVADVSVLEGNSGSTNAVFTVTLSPASNLTVTLQAATANGSATAGSDYTAVTQALTFTPGQTSQTVSVPVLGDLLGEGDETFVLTLSSPINASLARAQATGTILDDDGAPRLFIADATVSEGNSGTATTTFTVTLAPPAPSAVTVQYATANGTATTADNDYVATSGSLTFASGETSKSIVVTVNGDTRAEGNETFVVNLTNATNASIGRGQGTGTIQDDDLGGTVQLSSASYQAGENDGAVTVTVQRVGGVASNVTVQFATSDGTAQAGQDYTAATGTLTFGVGETVKTVSVSILADRVDESAETFTITLSSPTGGATLGTPAAATVTITEVDVTPCRTTLSASVPVGSTTLPVVSQQGCAVGDHVSINPGGSTEERAIVTGFGSIIVDQPTKYVHQTGEAVIRIGVQEDLGRAVVPPEDDTDKPRKLTETERQQRQRTNRSGLDDEHTEGNVTAVACDTAPPTVTIANRDGLVEVRLLGEAATTCGAVHVGDYLDAEGQKLNEQVYEATDVSVKRPGR